MFKWRENKIFGIVAGVIIVISIILLITTIVQRKRPVQLSPEQKAKMDVVIKQMKG